MLLIFFHPSIKQYRSCELHLFGQVGFLVSRIVKVVWFGRAELLRMRHQRTRMVFQSQLHWTRSISRIGARNAKVTETFYDGLERVHDAGALVCVGRMQCISVPTEQPCPASNAVVNHNGGTRGNTRTQVWRQLLGHHHRRVQ